MTLPMPTKTTRAPEPKPRLASTLTATVISYTHTPLPSKTTTPTGTDMVTPTIEPPTITPTTSYSERILIGTSVLSNPLEVYRFGYGPIRRMIVAGIHGGAELNTIELADELIQYLQDNPSLVPPDMTLYLLRSLNPDGELRVSGPEGRANQNGVDLNRNWDAFWQAEPDLSGCWSVYTLSTGEYPHSEPETQALATFLLDMEIDAFISYHSAGQGIYAGGQPADPDSIRLAKRLSEVSGYLYPPIDAGCVYTGQLIDWAVQQGIAAVDIELPNKWETQLDVNIMILEAFLVWDQ
jgi:predicted deacylase